MAAVPMPRHDGCHALAKARVHMAGVHNQVKKGISVGILVQTCKILLAMNYDEHTHTQPVKKRIKKHTVKEKKIH